MSIGKSMGSENSEFDEYAFTSMVAGPPRNIKHKYM